MIDSHETTPQNEILEPLSLEIKIKDEKGSTPYKKIFIGNSGLNFRITEYNPEVFGMHFSPDDYKGSGLISDEDRIKFSIVFCGAFYEFYQWWLNNDNFKDFQKPKIITGDTNEKMHKFRQNLFNTEENIIYNEIGKTSFKGQEEFYCYKIDLEKLKEAPEIIDLLRQSWERSKKGDIKMKVEKRKNET